MSNYQEKIRSMFPVIRTRHELIAEIESNKQLKSKYDSWNDSQKEEFIDICTGNRGIKLLYDSYFKENLNPEYDPERLSNLLSAVLGFSVKVKDVLPNDSTRIGDETSLIVTDIVVELEDHSLANIEVQKIGYKFLGERASCYTADLLLRQYKRLRDERKEHFSYKEIAPVYTIVFMESSSREFKEQKEVYVHRFSSKSDTGLKLNMLENYVFIPIDIFLENLHNNGIRSELDAWLTYLGCDEPEYLLRLIEEYPYFKKLYADLYDMCRNVERMMDMFSEELQILDRNTVKLMIDELQEERDSIAEELSNMKEDFSDTKEKLNDTKEELSNTKEELSNTKQQLSNAIGKTVKMLKDLNHSDAEIIKTISENFSLEEKEAKKYIQK